MQKSITRLNFDTYLAVIKNSVGSKLFHNLYVKASGKKIDATQNGELSCAFYVSSILTLFKFVKEIHGTVRGTIKDLEKFGWREVTEPEIGCVLVWEEAVLGDESAHEHIGFFMGNGKAISNSSKLGYPVEHSWDFNGKRKVKMILWSPKLK